MSSTADLLERVRPRLKLMVKIEKDRLGSKLRAYEEIAAAVGRSRSWLQNLLGRHGRVGLSAETAERFAALFDRISERIDAAAEHNKRFAAALRGDDRNAGGFGGGGADGSEPGTLDREPLGNRGGVGRSAPPLDRE